MNQNRRRLLLASASAALSATCPVKSAFAGPGYPNRPLTFICPWPAGGTADLTMRVLTAVLSHELRQPVEFKNIAGASGMIGTHSIVTAKPDGYTIGQIPISASRMAQLGMVTFDPLRDLSYLARASGQTLGIVVRADSPYQTLAELLTAARALPGKLTYGSAGLAGASHVGMEELLVTVGVKMHHVRYKGGAPALSDLLRGHIDAMCDSSSWVVDVKEGRLRLLATMGEERLAQFPDVPTLKDAGVNVVVDAPNGIGAPAGLDPQVKLKLRSALKKAITSSRFKQVCDSIHVPVMYLDAEEYRKYVLFDYERQKDLIQRLNLKEQIRNI